MNFLPHCSYCPTLLQKFDCCSLLPIFDILQTRGSNPADILLAFISQGSEFYYDILMMFFSLWVYAQAPLLFLRFLHQKSLRNGTLMLFYGIAKLSCDIMKITIFRESRPEGSCSIKFGLPSCHSQLAAFYLFWTLLTVFVYPKIRLTKLRAIECFIMLFVPYSRIYQIYHTYKQISYGFFFGIITACLGVFVLYLLELKWPAKIYEQKYSRQRKRQ